MNNPTAVKRSLKEIIEEKRLLQLQRAGLVADSELAEAPLPATELPLVAASNEVTNPTTPQNSEVKRKLSFKEILALKQGKTLPVEAVAPIPASNEIIAENLAPFPATTALEGEVLTEEEYTGAFNKNIELNSQQLMAKDMAFAGKSFCLVGAAGTGKTTAQREVARSLLESKCLGTHTFKIQGTKDYVTAPSIAAVAYTRVASGNLRRAIHALPELEEALQHNVTTIHNLLEYTPETYWDYEQNKECFRFIPRRNKNNPLDITHLIIEEASMVGLDLWEKLFEAMREGTQIIFIGDINQLPPVFGASILNYALVQLPVVELTHVYRQKGDSEILANAHRILKGEMVVEAPDYKIVRCGTTNHTQAKLATSLGITFNKWRTVGEYDPIQDIILSPWNKRELGTDNMNKWIAQFLGTERKATVWEVIAGMNKVYLAEGDKIMYNKQVGVITRIVRNARYMGRSPLPESPNLNRFGTYTGTEEETMEDLDSIDYSNLNLDAMIEDDKGDRTKEASHHVDILLDDGMEVTLSAVGDFGSSVFTLAYALTIHKAQGCEWRKVFLILHRDHSISLCREAFYTANTRAREQMIVIAKEEVIKKAIAIQKIKGNTIAEKIEYFNAGTQLNNAVYCTK